MAATKPDTTGRKRFAFRDVRSDAELLESGRPPKDLKFKKSNPAVKKLSKTNAKSAGASVFSALASRALPLAAKAAFGPVGGAVAAQIAGKYGGALLGKLKGSPSSAMKSASNASMGVQVQEETDPNKIRRPLGATPGRGVSSASASAAGKPLAETMAKSVLRSLVSSAAVASGLPTSPRIFKTPASLIRSPRFFNPKNRSFLVNADDKSKAEKAVRHVPISTTNAVLYPQAGLLEDEIMYRLTLLAENVYAPTKSRWPNIQILEGFRAENSTTSQHERGEAMDISAGNANRNFEVAQWMRDHVIYDQLILCHDIAGGSWIHVSFTIENRRRQVLTKTFNDTFVDGLHVYEQNSGTDIQTNADIEAGNRFITLMTERQSRLQPVDIDTDLPQQSSDLLGLVGGAGAEVPRCLVDPTGKAYVPDNSKQGAVIAAVEALLAIPEYFAMAQDPDPNKMVPFAREVAKRAGVGMNAKRGSGNLSGDAIAILNPTGAKGFGSWDTDKRVQIMDIVAEAHNPSFTPKAAWNDVTSVCADDPGGGYVEP